jgi:rubrerythrin
MARSWLAESERAPSRVFVELRCAACGYGVSVSIAPERCPMCSGTAWEHAAPVRPRAHETLLTPTR